MRSNRFAAVAGWGLLPLALLPFGASVAFHAGNPQPQPGAPAAERGSLVFEQYLVNLREIEPTREATAGFAFTNAGAHPLTITALEPGCGCLVPRLEKRSWLPGESGRLDVRIQTATETAGPKEYAIVVKYSDPEPREVRLLFKVVLPERQVLVEPRALLVYHFGAPAALERDIIVTDFRKRALLVSGVEVTTPWAAARVADAAEDAEGNHRTRIVVTVDQDIPEGEHHGHIVMRTTDPEFSQLVVPLSIERRQGDHPLRPQLLESRARRAVRPR